MKKRHTLSTLRGDLSDQTNCNCIVKVKPSYLHLVSSMVNREKVAKKGHQLWENAQDSLLPRMPWNIQRRDPENNRGGENRGVKSTRC